MSLWERLLSFIFLHQLRRRIYRKTYQRYRDLAVREHIKLMADARVMQDRLIAEAKQDATTIKQAALKDAKAHAAGELVKAREAAIRKANASVETDRQEAIKQGRSDGWLAAYNEAAADLGLATVSEVIDMPLSALQSINLSRLYPNIFCESDRWVVRVIVNGELHVRVFQFTKKDQAVKLIAAIKYRNVLAPADKSHYRALYRECYDEAARNRPAGVDNMEVDIRAAELFHVRLQHAEITPDRVQFAGEDPEDRLNIPDTSILVMPWPELLGNSKRLIEAFESIGIDPRRTVRDLLLFTGDDLLEARYIGEAALRKIREGLATYGLALWGDNPPAPRATHRDGSQEFRGITLDE